MDFPCHVIKNDGILPSNEIKINGIQTDAYSVLHNNIINIFQLTGFNAFVCAGISVHHITCWITGKPLTISPPLLTCQVEVETLNHNDKFC